VVQVQAADVREAVGSPARCDDGLELADVDAEGVVTVYCGQGFKVDLSAREEERGVNAVCTEETSERDGFIWARQLVIRRVHDAVSEGPGRDEPDGDKAPAKNLVVDALP
jgi:hypothetical protein